MELNSESERRDVITQTSPNSHANPQVGGDTRAGLKGDCPAVVPKPRAGGQVPQGHDDTSHAGVLCGI